MKKIYLLFFLSVFFFSYLTYGNEIIIEVKRTAEGETVTFGELWISGAPVCQTMELPYRNNEPSNSCIKPGFYKGFIRKKTVGWRIEFEKKNNREFVQIHKGSDLINTVGCILVGTSINRGTGEISGDDDAFEKIKEALQAAGMYPTMTSFAVKLTVTGEKGN